MFVDREQWLLRLQGLVFAAVGASGIPATAAMVSGRTQRGCKSHPAQWLWRSGLMISTRCQCRFIGLDIKSLCCSPWQIKAKTGLELHNRFDCALECVTHGGACGERWFPREGCEWHSKIGAELLSKKGSALLVSRCPYHLANKLHMCNMHCCTCAIKHSVFYSKKSWN